jgi:hypothetical protein
VLALKHYLDLSEHDVAGWVPRAARRRWPACSRSPAGRRLYRGFSRIAVTAPSVHPAPLRCGLRSGSAADGHGTPASFSARAIRATECPARRWAKIHRTRGAVCGSGSRRCARRPPRGVRLVRVRSGIGEPVPVRRTPARVPALLPGLDGHRGADPDTRPTTKPAFSSARTTWLPRVAGTGGIRHVGDGDPQLLGHPEFREPAVQSLTEVDDSLLRVCPSPLAPPPGSGAWAHHQPVSSCSTVYGTCTTRSAGVSYPRPSPGHGAVVKTRRPRACAAVSIRPNWPGGLIRLWRLRRWRGRRPRLPARTAPLPVR